jgi:hypothetical protein
MKIKPEQDILIEYSGWCVIDPDKVKFQCITNDEACGEQIITGKEWLKLDDDMKSNYILENAVDAMRDSDDGEWDTLEVSESNGTRYWELEGYLK